MRSPWIIFFLFIAILLSSTPLPSKAAEGNTILKFGIHVSAMGNLDPHFAVGSQDRAVADMVFNALLRYIPGNAPKIEPDLARTIPEFRMEQGRQVWMIRLKKGVYFHQGPNLPAHELTSEDVIFSLQKSGDKKFCASASAYSGMSFKKLNDYNFEIALEQPISPILFFPKLANYGGGFILSKKAMDTMGYERLKNHPIGTGPFKFRSHEPGTGLMLESNDRYFRGKPELDGVEIKFLPKLAQRESHLKQGLVDIITGSGEENWIKKMEKEPGIDVDTHGVGEVGSVYFNTRFPPLDDIRVRKAMAYALSRHLFLKVTSPRISGPVFSQVPNQFLPGGLDQAQAENLGLDYGRNLEKAKQLMKEAGFPKGFDLDLVSSEKRIYQRSYNALKEQLAQIGIRCNIQVVPHSAMHKAIRNEPKAIVIYFAWRPNADVYLTRFFHSDAILISGKRPDTNFSHYREIDPMIEAARLETDPRSQMNLWVQAQIKILNDMAALPTMFTQQCYARRTDLEYGHRLVSTMALYPQFTEKTRFNRE